MSSTFILVAETFLRLRACITFLSVRRINLAATHTTKFTLVNPKMLPTVLMDTKKKIASRIMAQIA